MNHADRIKKAFLFFAVIPLVSLAVIAISYFHILDTYELETLDARFVLRPGIPQTDKVALIEIGDDTLEQLGVFPFDRSYHALLINALAESGAKYIIFDLFFSEPHEHDSELEDAMRKAGNVYLPFVLDLDAKKKGNMISASKYRAKTLDNLKLLAKGEGSINVEPDPDGKFRRIPLYIRYGNGFYPYISFLASCDYLGIPQKDVNIMPGRYVLLGSDFKIPLDENSNMIVNFSGKWKDAYRHYSFVDILQSYIAKASGQKPRLDLNVFKDKVCIVGLTASGSVDLHPNPFESLYPAVGMHAELFNSILNKKFISRAPRAFNVTILVFLGILVTLFTTRTKPLKGLFVLLGLIVIFVIAAIIVFDAMGLWIDIFYPVLIMSLVYLFSTLYRYACEWKKRMLLENELEIAKKIQESFLPKTIPEVKGLEIAASMFTARQVGGDLYDFIQMPDGRFGVMIGDVSGKGVPASLFMAMVTGTFKFFSTMFAEPREVFEKLNSKIVKESSSNLFVTMFYAIFDLERHKLSYSNGGHLPLLYISPGKEPRFLDVSEGTPLGLMEGPYGNNEIGYAPGDIFVFYTDGITEAMNARHDMYGSDRLVAMIKSAPGLSAGELLEVIGKDVRKFERKEKQHDDMTLVIIKVKGGG